MTHISLADLGWSEAFARQLAQSGPLFPHSPSSTDAGAPLVAAARITDVHRSAVGALDESGERRLGLSPEAEPVAVGDWILHDGVRVVRRLAPKGEIARRGLDGQRQLIAANVDTLAIVTALGSDYSLGRIERYLAIALQAGALPLVILTRADLAPDAPVRLREVRALSPLITALAFDARDPAEAERLAAWCGPGQTLAFVGSSGVGKTTLRNALTGETAATRAARAGDDKGRHTTTARALRRALAGGFVLDTPGMRELGLVDAAEGLAQVFGDIDEIARACRFADCSHQTEPGCAVRAAIADGRLDAARLARARKLEREDRHATEALHERHARVRGFARQVRDGAARSRAKRRGWGDD